MAVRHMEKLIFITLSLSLTASNYTTDYIGNYESDLFYPQIALISADFLLDFAQSA
jgi:hypothetical protein